MIRQLASRVWPLLLILLSFGPSSSALAQSSKAVKLSAGLEASISMAGRDKTGQSVAVVLSLVNRSNATVYAMLLSASSGLTDNAGGSYRQVAVEGLTECTSVQLGACMGLPMKQQTVALQRYTRLDPGTGVEVNFKFDGKPSHGPLLNLAASMVVRTVDNPEVDATLSEEKKRQQLQTIPLSFKQFPVVAAER